MRSMAPLTDIIDTALSDRDAKFIWSGRQLPRGQLPPLGSILFGTFQVIDLQICNHDDIASNTYVPEDSYVDVGFGSDRSSFAGFHRFSVSRHAGTDDRIDEFPETNSSSAHDTDSVRITLSSLSCNPTQDRPRGSSLLRSFHSMYSMFLFREGVANVLRHRGTTRVA